MSAQTLTDVEKAGIEKEIKKILDELVEASLKVDISYAESMVSDQHGLGFIDGGVFYPSSKEVLETFRKGFGQLERQEELAAYEYRTAVMAPDVVIVTSHSKTKVYRKDGNTFTGVFGQTFVLMKIEGEWKCIHSHQSVHPAEE